MQSPVFEYQLHARGNQLAWLGIYILGRDHRLLQEPDTQAHAACPRVPRTQVQLSMGILEHFRTRLALHTS